LDSIATFFNMGGYAQYIWPAYGIVTVGLAGLFIVTKRFASTSMRTLELLRGDDEG
jgi:heme exporter protein CcmD